MATLLELGQLSEASYNPNTPSNQLPSGWVQVDQKSDTASGYSGVAYFNSTANELVIANSGTQLSFSDVAMDAMLGVGVPTPSDKAALAFTNNLLDNPSFSGASIILTGHSKGGNEAQYVVTQLDNGTVQISAVTYNSPGVSPLVLDPNANYDVVNIRNTGDIISLIGPHAGDVLTIDGGPGLADFVQNMVIDGLASLPIGGPLGVGIGSGVGLSYTALQAHLISAINQYLFNHPAIGNLSAQQFSSLSSAQRETLAIITPLQYGAMTPQQRADLPLSTPEQVQTILQSLPPGLTSFATAPTTTIINNPDGSRTLSGQDGYSVTVIESGTGDVTYSWTDPSGAHGSVVQRADGSATSTFVNTDGSSVVSTVDSSGGYTRVELDPSGNVILPTAPVTNTIDISNPYDGSQTSTSGSSDPTNVSDVEGGEIAPGVSMDPARVNGPMSYFNAEAGAIAGNYVMPANGNIVPTAQQDAQLLTWGDVFQDVSAGSSSSLIPVDPIVGAYSNALNLQSFGIDPLILDLNGDGVRLTSYQDHLVLFDVDHDGPSAGSGQASKEQTGWVAANTITGGTPPAINTDGIVVQDLNGNGVIDDISETLSEFYNGTVGTGGNAGTKPFVNGFEALASSSLNTVADGVFNSSDAGWNTLRVWVDDNADGLSFKDVNGDGTYQPGTDTSELKAFAELGITSINLTPTTQSGLVNGGNEILATGSFVIGGQIRAAQAATFLANPDGHTFLTQQNGANTGAKIVTQGETGGTSSYVSHSATGEVMDAAALGVNNLYGGAGNDTLTGDANGNWLAGGVGSDTFNAGAGDRLRTTRRNRRTMRGWRERQPNGTIVTPP